MCEMNVICIRIEIVSWLQACHCCEENESVEHETRVGCVDAFSLSLSLTNARFYPPGIKNYVPRM